MPLEPHHADFWTEALQFTPTVHRDVYPAVDPSQDCLQEIANGKVVLVTGAGSGFGEAACRQWAKAGAKAIILAARSKAFIDAVVETLRTIAPATDTLAIPTDVAAPEDVDHLFEAATQRFQSVDVVVHCAGVLGPLENLGEAPVDAWVNAFDINLKGTFLVARALARVSEKRSVSFIHAGTAASYFASPGQSSYTSSKAASNMILDQLAVEYSNIRVFNVHPGMAKSKVLRKELEVYAKDNPELFGSLSVYLAGPRAEFLRGRFIAANWDVTELDAHREEIVRDGLLRNQPFKGQIGPGGHRFNSNQRE